MATPLHWCRTTTRVARRRGPAQHAPATGWVRKAVLARPCRLPAPSPCRAEAPAPLGCCTAWQPSGRTSQPWLGHPPPPPSGQWRGTCVPRPGSRCCCQTWRRRQRRGVALRARPGGPAGQAGRAHLCTQSWGGGRTMGLVVEVWPSGQSGGARRSEIAAVPHTHTCDAAGGAGHTAGAAQRGAASGERGLGHGARRPRARASSPWGGVICPSPEALVREHTPLPAMYWRSCASPRLASSRGGGAEGCADRSIAYSKGWCNPSPKLGPPAWVLVVTPG